MSRDNIKRGWTPSKNTFAPRFFLMNIFVDLAIYRMACIFDYQIQGFTRYLSLFGEASE